MRFFPKTQSLGFSFLRATREETALSRSPHSRPQPACPDLANSTSCHKVNQVVIGSQRELQIRSGIDPQWGSQKASKMGSKSGSQAIPWGSQNAFRKRFALDHLRTPNPSPRPTDSHGRSPEARRATPRSRNFGARSTPKRSGRRALQSDPRNLV